MLKSNISITLTPILEWNMVGCESKNWHQENTCIKEIGLRAQNTMTILGSLVNMIGKTYMTTR